MTESVISTTASRLFTLGERGNRLFRVRGGEVDLFLCLGPAGEDSRRRHFASVSLGEWIFDIGFGGSGGFGDRVQILGDGSPGVCLEPVEEFTPEEAARALDGWITRLGRAILHLSGAEHDFTRAVAPGELPALEAGEVLGVRREVAWWQPPGSDVVYLGRQPGSDLFLPLVPRLGVNVRGATPPSRLLSTRELVALPGWRERLAQTQAFMVEALLKALAVQDGEALQRGCERLALRSAADAAAWSAISEVLLSRSPVSLPQQRELRSVESAFHRVAGWMGVPPAMQNTMPEGVDPLEQIAGLARAASMRWRQVLLGGPWFTRDHGPMIGLLAASGEAVALLPMGARRYQIIHGDGSTEPVTTAVAERLAPQAVVLYRALPGRKLTFGDIGRFALSRSSRDLWMVVAMIAVTGLLALATPALSARIYDVIIPQAERGLMAQITLILVAAALTGAAFELVRTVALMRVENRAEGHLQAAVWDRLLKLPSQFFRQFTAGDLAGRVQGITEAYQILSTTGTALLFAVPTGLFNLLVMFHYSRGLALWGLAIALGGAGIALGLNVAELLVLRRQYAIRGKLAGLVVQLINGVGKFRMANAESFAFATWAREYAGQERLSVKAGKWTIASQTFFSGFPLLVTAVIFALVGRPPEPGAAPAPDFTTGAFLAFNTAFGALITSLVLVAQNSLGLLQAVPLLERTRPILEAEPEATLARAHPGELQGEIEINDVRFGYREGAPPVLDGLSLKIRPGEMVALVGPSGCGKSTLLRLLLGFETPDSGTILYDGKDLQSLNLQEVRRQIGVVLQSTQLFVGDVFRNILGESSLTLQDAWEAAEMAGLGDDIRAMPMQMHTLVSEGGGGFSGGQKQRLAIARAFVHKPRLLFFDEATSALDNRTQARVTESMERLQVTRVIVAHRLSTIMKAHRIVVLREGRVCEEGTYEELMAKRGAFHELARHQIA